MRRDSNFHPWNLLPIEHHKETGLHLANITAIAVLVLLIVGLFAAALIPQRHASSTTVTHSQTVVTHPYRSSGQRK